MNEIKPLPRLDASWRVNVPDVSAELVDGEVVAIHLPSGMYFSLRGTAAAIWEGIDRGENFGQLVRWFTDAYDVGAAEAGEDVAALLERLSGESLIADGAKAANPRPAFAGARQPYAAPQMEKFSDLQDLLLLDPIHEVDQRGWPHEKPQ